jgi:hypothetical protein
MNRRIGTFKEFQEHTLAVVRGERQLNSRESRLWSEPIADQEQAQSVPVDLAASHYLQSTLRERIVEHVFVGEALRQLWKRGATDVEVLRSEFEAGGYDLVMSYRKTVRHIQFKSTTEGGKTTSVTISSKLLEKPSGCVIWIGVSPRDLELKSYRWFGGTPGEPLPNISNMKVARHVRGNAKGIKVEKPNHRIVPRSRFEQLPTMDAVLDRLFGPLPGTD